MWPVPVPIVLSIVQFIYICIERQVLCQGFYSKHTSNWMLRFCKEILQCFQYSIHSEDWLLAEETSAGQNQNTYLIWCLK